MDGYPKKRIPDLYPKGVVSHSPGLSRHAGATLGKTQNARSHPQRGCVRKTSRGNQARDVKENQPPGEPPVRIAGTFSRTSSKNKTSPKRRTTTKGPDASVWRLDDTVSSWRPLRRP